MLHGRGDLALVTHIGGQGERSTIFLADGCRKLEKAVCAPVDEGNRGAFLSESNRRGSSYAGGGTGD
jgi:hypothetical protein